ncbi:cation transport protein-domain-containing protein [Ilyonectria sp. MPI-CAGE-AT-0026]|nr:cation transport protein-domain-containing protein [Ilyonectria sp. MPI-CAGE-AT-0026]
MLRWDDFVDGHPWVAKVVSARRYLPPLNFITIHYAYFSVVCLISSVIFWQSSHPSSPISYTDSLFLVVSAMTEAGLNTVNLSILTTWQQTMLFLLIMLGSTIWVSIWTVLARKHVFEKRFERVVRAERARRLSRQNSSISLALPKLWKAVSFRKAQTIHKERPRSQHASSLPDVDIPAKALAEPPSPGGHIVFVDAPQRAVDNNATSTGTSYFDEIQPTRRNGAAKTLGDHANGDLGIHHFLTSHSSNRNGQFHSLTSEERENLGGCEYRALKVLAVVVPIYFFLWQFLGCIALGAWISNNMPDTAKANGINPWWLGIFNGVSAFNNSGMSLLDANMIPFQNSYFVLITMGLMILAGNTAYPLFLRLIIWTGLKLLKAVTKEDAFEGLKATLEFVLKYPRRVYTNLFPSCPTWWLFFMLVSLNSIDWVAFELLNLGNPFIDSLSVGSRIIDGLFQALAVRSGGFYIVPISQLYIGLQVLYVIMMYISVYPVVITMRHSNVYEERSLGIYGGDELSNFDSDPEAVSPLLSPNSHNSAQASNTNGRTFTWHGVGVPPMKRGNTPDDGPASCRPDRSSNPNSRISFISQQIHGQLAHDIWWLVVAVLVITTIETSNFMADPVTFSVFNIIFEVVSAYGTVGISVGIPTAAYSFSGAWHTASKLILCLVMLRGRHRGLPVALDQAVRLPGEQLHHDEEQDHRIRRSMTRRRMDL